MKKLYENFNSIVKEFEEDCGKEIDYKEIVKKYIKQDGEKTLSIYVYNLHMRVKSFKEESEKCNKSKLIIFLLISEITVTKKESKRRLWIFKLFREFVK